MDKFPASLAALLIIGSLGAVPIVGWGAVFGTLVAVGVSVSIVSKL